MMSLAKVSTRLKGIHQLSGRGNCYLFEKEGLLLDTGAPGDLEGLEILPHVENVLLTHSHECHAGGLIKVCSAYSPRVFCSELAVEMLKNRHGIPEERIEPLKGNETLSFGKLRFRVIPCPGHTKDSMAFYETKRGLLFTGDSVFVGEERRIPQGADLGEWAESVRFLSTLKVSFLLPGHGEVQRGKNVPKMIVESYAFLQGKAEGDPLMGLIAGGIQYADLDMMPEALEMFDAVLAKEPENPGAAFSKGLTLLKMSRFKEAVDCFDLALRVVPDFKEAANAKALALAAVKGVNPER